MVSNMHMATRAFLKIDMLHGASSDMRNTINNDRTWALP